MKSNFNQAIKWLKEGKKVRRPSWKEDSYWKLGEDESIQWVTGQAAHIHLNQINADDWEIYEEKQKLEIQISPEKLAKVFHESYEKISKQQGWKTQNLEKLNKKGGKNV